MEPWTPDACPVAEQQTHGYRHVHDAKVLAGCSNQATAPAAIIAAVKAKEAAYLGKQDAVTQ